MQHYNFPSLESSQCWPLLKFIESIDELAWRKFSGRLNPDCNQSPHALCFVAFRFVKEHPDFIVWLRREVECFPGKLKWKVYERKRIDLPGINRSIQPMRNEEIEQKADELNLSYRDYLSIFEPDYTELAFNDIQNLGAYLDRRWRNSEM